MGGRNMRKKGTARKRNLPALGAGKKIRGGGVTSDRTRPARSVGDSSKTVRRSNRKAHHYRPLPVAKGDIRSL